MRPRKKLSSWVKKRKKMTKKTSLASDEKIEKARLYLQLSIDSNKTVHDAYERLCQKIKGIFATSCTLIPIVAGLGYFVLKEGYTIETLYLIIFSLVAFFIAVAIGFLLHGPGDFKYMDASVLFKKYKDKPLRFLINKSASTLADITAHNSDVLNSKEKWIKIMLSFILLGLVLATIAFVSFGMGILN